LCELESGDKRILGLDWNQGVLHELSHTWTLSLHLVLLSISTFRKILTSDVVWFSVLWCNRIRVPGVQR
jgi:hypothetical protein